MTRRLSLFGLGALLSLIFLAFLSPENKLKNTFFAYLNYFDSDKRIVGQLLLSKEFNYLVSDEEDISLFLDNCWVNHDLSDKDSYPQKFVLENVMPKRLEASVYYCVNTSISKEVLLFIDTNSYILNFSQNVSEYSNSEKIKVFNNKLKNHFSEDQLQITHKRFLKGDNQYIDNINWERDTFSTINIQNGGVIFIRVHNYFEKSNWRLFCDFYDKEIIKEQGGDRIMTFTDFVKLDTGVNISSKSYKSSYIIILSVLLIMFVVIYFIRKKITNNI
tara:strand:- start:16171 stop:16995 length:825 start_codon:yes stop_codon:yes gene_type:complete